MTSRKPKAVPSKKKRADMVTARNATAEPVKPRNAVQVPVRDPSDRQEMDNATARTITRPEVRAATTIQQWGGDALEVNALARELMEQVAAVNNGDLKRAEGMLIAQAHTLDALFGHLARRAHSNMGEYLNAADTYLRLALKAQSQCRATLETLAEIKNPMAGAYVRQANIAAGHQQVNNSAPPADWLSGARETENQQSKQLGVCDELLPDTRAPALASRVNQEVEAMGAIHRAEVAGR